MPRHIAQALTLTALATLVAVSCRDPNVGPPPRRLDRQQTLRVEGFLLERRPAPEFPSEAVFGKGQIRLLGTDVSPQPAARGQKLRIRHYFEVLAPIEKSWKIFVHVHAAGAAGVLVNADHFPVEGLLPTDRWRPGQIIEDAYTIEVPKAAPDELVGHVGFYRFDDRLPVSPRSAHDGANRAVAFRVAVSGEAPALPTYRAPRRTRPIVIDGALGDPGWDGVPSTGPFVRTGDGGVPAYRTEAWLTWDEEALYIAFQVQDEDVWAKLSRDDEPIYTEEVVEVFLDADGDGRTYNELQVSPRNVRFDAYFPARRQGMDLSWSSGMESAVTVQGTLNDPSDRDRGWTVEMRVPVASLAALPRRPPAEGDVWRFNLYRLEWHSGRKVNEGSAFSPPLVGDFHHLARFGRLELGGAQEPADSPGQTRTNADNP